MLPFPNDGQRQYPYLGNNFVVMIDGCVLPDVIDISALSVSTDVVRSMCDSFDMVQPGRSTYSPFTITRYRNHSRVLSDWANASLLQKSVCNYRKNVQIMVKNICNQEVMRFVVLGAWVSKYQFVSDLNALNYNTISESVEITCNSIEIDSSIMEPLV